MGKIGFFSAKKERCSNGPLLNLVSHNKHMLTWILIFLALFTTGMRYDATLSLISSTISVSTMILLDQLVRRFLIPKFLSRDQHQLHYYLASFIVVYFLIWGGVLLERIVLSELIISGIVKFKYNEEITNAHRIFPFVRMAVLLIGTFSISTISFLLSRTKAAYKISDNLRNEKLDMELRYLKAQINPHFLFNALNNIYSLSYTNDSNAPEAILKLSEMLRYVTDECQSDKISISKEVKYIESYIDFQKMRVESLPNVEFIHNIMNPEFKVTPMIFQPLVENAFKHSRVENNKDGYVKFYLHQNDKELVFISENTRAACFAKKTNDRSGIGVDNVRKRLDLAYGNKYIFDIEDNEKYYRSTIKIKIR